MDLVLGILENESAAQRGLSVNLFNVLCRSEGIIEYESSRKGIRRFPRGDEELKDI